MCLTGMPVLFGEGPTGLVGWGAVEVGGGYIRMYNVYENTICMCVYVHIYIKQHWEHCSVI